PRRIDLLAEDGWQATIPGLVVLADEPDIPRLEVTVRGVVVHVTLIVIVSVPMLLPMLLVLMPMVCGGGRRRQQAQKQNSERQSHHGLHSGFRRAQEPYQGLRMLRSPKTTRQFINFTPTSVLRRIGPARKWTGTDDALSKPCGS